MFVLQSWSNSLAVLLLAAVGHQGGQGPLNCVWGVAGPTWVGHNWKWQGDCCLPPDTFCVCVYLCVLCCFACSNVLSCATLGPRGPVSQVVSCGCLGFLQWDYILTDLIWYVEHAISGLKCVLDILSGNETYFFGGGLPDFPGIWCFWKFSFPSITCHLAVEQTFRWPAYDHTLCWDRTR